MSDFCECSNTRSYYQGVCNQCGKMEKFDLMQANIRIKKCIHAKGKTFHLFKFNGKEILLCNDCEREIICELISRPDTVERMIKDFIENTINGKEIKP